MTNDKGGFSYRIFWMGNPIVGHDNRLLAMIIGHDILWFLFGWPSIFHFNFLNTDISVTVNMICRGYLTMSLKHFDLRNCVSECLFRA